MQSSSYMYLVLVNIHVLIFKLILYIYMWCCPTVKEKLFTTSSYIIGIYHYQLTIILLLLVVRILNQLPMRTVNELFYDFIFWIHFDTLQMSELNFRALCCKEHIYSAPYPLVWLRGYGAVVAQYVVVAQCSTIADYGNQNVLNTLHSLEWVIVLNLAYEHPFCMCTSTGRLQMKQIF